MTTTRQDIFNLLHQNQDRLRTLGVNNIGLFGSFLKGEQHSNSDIDLLVEFFPEHKTFDNFMELSFFLEKIFKRRIELIPVESLIPCIGPHILKEFEYSTFAA